MSILSLRAPNGNYQVARQELIYYDVNALYTARKAVVTISHDTGATAPTNIQPTTHVITRSKGDNATFIGASSAYWQTRDRSDVTGSNKGVLYTAQLATVPLVARNNSPFDDATVLVITNDSDNASKATDAVYIGHNSAFGASHEFITGFQVDANCDYAFYTGASRSHTTGIELRSTFANYGIDAKLGTFTGGVIRFGNNQTAIVGRNAADGADLTMLKMNTNNDIAIGSSGVVRANCNSAQLGFFGTTPIAKITTGVAGATFVANSGTGVNDASTFGGYTIKQMAQALQNYGLLT